MCYQIPNIVIIKTEQNKDQKNPSYKKIDILEYDLHKFKNLNILFRNICILYKIYTYKMQNYREIEIKCQYHMLRKYERFLSPFSFIFLILLLFCPKCQEPSPKCWPSIVQHPLPLQPISCLKTSNSNQIFCF